MTASSSSVATRSVGQRVLVGVLAALAGGAFLVLVALVALVGLHQFGGRRPDPAVGGLAVGSVAPPPIAAGWVHGKPGDLAGKVTVIDGWFVGCPHCWNQAPELAALHRKYAPQGVAFVGLTTDPPDALAEVEGFVRDNGLEYPNGYGAYETLTVGYEAQYFPSVWVIGRDGKVAWNRASADRQGLEEAIVAALAAE